MADLTKKRTQAEVVRLGSEAHDYLHQGDIFKGRYIVERNIGRGGFGQVYQVKDLSTKSVVALKVEPRGKESRMQMEHMVLKKMDGAEHFPVLFAHDACDQFCYMTMPILGENLHELRRIMPRRRFTPQFGLQVMRQMVDALEALHTAGFVHRDVKPANMCVGKLPTQRERVYLIDFGMARKFLLDGGRIRPRRRSAAFRGTSRYASANAHARADHGPRDDLYSLFYSVVEMCEGQLPWKGTEQEKLVWKAKTDMFKKFDKVLLYTPRNIVAIPDYLDILQYEDQPNYTFIRSTIDICLKSTQDPLTRQFSNRSNGSPIWSTPESSHRPPAVYERSVSDQEPGDPAEVRRYYWPAQQPLQQCPVQVEFKNVVYDPYSVMLARAKARRTVANQPLGNVNLRAVSGLVVATPSADQQQQHPTPQRLDHVAKHSLGMELLKEVMARRGHNFLDELQPPLTAKQDQRTNGQISGLINSSGPKENDGDKNERLGTWNRDMEPGEHHDNNDQRQRQTNGWCETVRLQQIEEINLSASNRNGNHSSKAPLVTFQHDGNLNQTKQRCQTIETERNQSTDRIPTIRTGRVRITQCYS